jgi:hypothetical protein
MTGRIPVFASVIVLLSAVVAFVGLGAGLGLAFGVGATVVLLLTVDFERFAARPEPVRVHTRSPRP